MTSRRLKLVLLLAGLAASGLALLAWTQQWFGVTLTDGRVLEVLGDTAAPAVSALALSGVVLVGALAIAGPVFRVILGILGSLIGFTIGFSAVLALLEPATASRALITEATGIAGNDAVTSEVTDVAVLPWGWVAVVAGVLLVIVGVLIAASARRWPGSTRRYNAVTVTREDGNPIDDWDSLSEGRDPTGGAEEGTRGAR